MNARSPVADAVDPLAIWTLADLDPAQRRRVDAVVMVTHDLVLDLVLREFLPAYLPEPDALRRGMGPEQRVYRERMADLPPVTVLSDVNASVSLETAWRPPSLDLVAWSRPRRMHAKVGIIVYQTIDSSDQAHQWLRLVVSSGNLTRRAFTANLEVLHGEDVPLEQPSPILTDLLDFLDFVARDHPGFAATRAVRHVLDALKRLPARVRGDGGARLRHSGDPELFADRVAVHLRTVPERSRGVSDVMLVSPFYPPTGARLQKFLAKDCRLERHTEAELVVAFDQRSAQSGVRDRSVSTVPPRWLLGITGGEAMVLTPAEVTRRRGGGEAESQARGTGRPGRPLHAKLMAVGHRRQGTDRKLWQVVLGSANLTEHGLGLCGAMSNIEACILVADREPRESPLPLTAPAERRDALLVSVDAPAEREEIGLSAAEIAADLHRRAVIDLMTRPGAIVLHRLADGLRVTVQAAGLPEDLSIRWGRTGPLLARIGDAFVVDLPGRLSSWFITVTYAGADVVIPIPVDDVVANILIAACGAPRRDDRILEYWIGGGPSEDDERSEVDADLPGEQAARAASPDAYSRLDSWRLNRLLLAIRRRMAEPQGVLPPASLLLDWARFQDIADEIAKLDPVAQGYATACLQAMCMGYRAQERSRLGEDRRRSTRGELRDDPVVSRWRRHPIWERWSDKRDELVKCEPRLRASLMRLEQAYFDSCGDGDD